MALSIIVPTFNEGANVRILAQHIDKIFEQQECPGLYYEILFIDDSTDETPLILSRLSSENDKVKVYHRDNVRGLGTAVVKGFSLAKGDLIIVMDADLQHPPELIPNILDELKSGTDLVIPSRFIPGGADGGLNLPRKAVSWIARTMARLLLKKARPITDCTSGYFGLHRNVIEGVPLKPIGWKILLEIIIKGRYNSVVEIPYNFSARKAKDSKMSLGVQLGYLMHILFLTMSSPEDRRFYLFCLAGMIGFFINMLVFALVMALSGEQPILSSITASLVAMFNNFFLNDRVTWKSQKSRSPNGGVARFFRFGAVCSFGVLFTSLVVKLFTLLSWSPYIGQMVGIACVAVINYNLNNRWTWKDITIHG